MKFTQEDSYQFLRGMAESYGIELVRYEPSELEIVVIWATRLKEAWRSADENPGNPHAGDEIEYAEDSLKRATKDWLDTLSSNS